MVNRAALFLRYKPPAVVWINDADPYDRDPGSTVESVNEERTVYLISGEDADTADTLSRWVKENYLALFENELEGWYVDETLWPKNRDFETFNEWFSVECHTVLIDTVGGEIFDDGI
jgi:hypothetical protein